MRSCIKRVQMATYAASTINYFYNGLCWSNGGIDDRGFVIKGFCCVGVLSCGVLYRVCICLVGLTLVWVLSLLVLCIRFYRFFWGGNQGEDRFDVLSTL